MGASSVLHILDDFLFIAKTKDRCEADLGNFISLCHHLGVPLSPEKTVGPDTVLQFAGIILDSVYQTTSFKNAACSCTIFISVSQPN